jgi:hypothetical protein
MSERNCQHESGCQNDAQTGNGFYAYRGPVRAVVEHRSDGSLLLECGHRVWRRTSHDERRRCAQCPTGASKKP